MTARLLLDTAEIAELLREAGHDVVAVVDDAGLRSQSDAELFRWAAGQERRIVTENIKDFRPLLMQAYVTEEAVAQLLLVSPRRFPRGGGDRSRTGHSQGADLVADTTRRRPRGDWPIRGGRPIRSPGAMSASPWTTATTGRSDIADARMSSWRPPA